MTLPASLRIAILAAICGTTSPISLAQGPPKDEILRGPAVNDRDVPGATSEFSESKGRPDKFHRDPRLAHRQFMDAVRSLEGPEVAPDLRLTEAQLAQIDAIDSELRAALETFKTEHQAEIDALKEKAGEMRTDRRERGPRGEPGPDGAPPPGPDGKGKGKGKNTGEAPTPEVAAAREQLKALRNAGPKPEDCHTRMWAVLSAPQQTLVQSRLDNMQDDRRERRGDEMREPRSPRAERSPDGDRGPRGQRSPEGRSGPGGPEGARGPDGEHGPRADRGPDARRDFRSPASPLGGEAGRPRPGEGFPPNPRFAHLLERFNALPPEAQDRFIQRMEEMLSRMEDRRGPKPPPPMDDVAVPPPPPATDDAGEPMPPPAPNAN